MLREEARKTIIKERDSLRANPMVKVEDCLYEAFNVAIKALEQERQSKTGKWIVYYTVNFGDFAGTEKYECSECHHRVGVFNSKFCPDCGAKMEEDK